MSPAVVPGRDLERQMLAAHALVGGMDEVGRGAIAGPVSVGLAVVSRRTPQAFPDGLSDSKQLSPKRRRSLVGPVQEWVEDYAVCHASPAEIDALGIVGALRLAGLRALEQVAARGNLPGAVLLDGVSDWLSPPEVDLLDQLLGSGQGLGGCDVPVPPVRTQVKADARCAVVAAASVLAKVERDTLMESLEDPGYEWARNKGYASAAHQAGLSRLGASELHRRSWRLPGLASS